MFTSYARVLGRPGALRFSLTGMFARLPISMVGLGIVLLVEASTGSYGLAGAVSAAYMLANALLAIAQGRLVDRLGQAPVLATASVVFGAALTTVIWSVQAGWPVAATYAAAALAGASLPQIGSCVRARWSHVLDAPADVQTAFALEAVVDEACFILGPILVTVLATAVHPVAGLGSAMVFGTLGGLLFAAQRGTEPPAQPHDRRTGPRPPLPWRTLVPLVAVSGMLGVLFGAAEVTTIAFADEQGSRAWAGPLLALWALGSLVAGVVVGRGHLARGPGHPAEVGRVRDGGGDGAAPPGRVGAGDGSGAAGGRGRDRADDDRHDVADRGHDAAQPAHRGHVGGADRSGGRCRARGDAVGAGRRRLGRLDGLPGAAGGRPAGGARGADDHFRCGSRRILMPAQAASGTSTSRAITVHHVITPSCHRPRR